MSITVLDPSTRDLSADVMVSPGRPNIMPASYYAETSPAERAMLCLRNGLYGLPTTELVDFLKTLIADRSAIEIGAGHGALAAALGIPATDSRMQDEPAIKAHYDLMRQPTVRYGDEVEKLDAHAAVEKYRPRVVVASWVTHLYDPARHEAGGNQFGVDERRIVASCEAYVFVGNAKVHAGKEIWTMPHVAVAPDFVYSRASNGSPDFVAVWGSAPEIAMRAAA